MKIVLILIASVVLLGATKENTKSPSPPTTDGPREDKGTKETEKANVNETLIETSPFPIQFDSSRSQDPSGEFSPVVDKTIAYAAKLLLEREQSRIKIQSYLQRKRHCDKYIVPDFGPITMTALSWEYIESKAKNWKVAPVTVKKIYSTLNRLYTVIGKKWGLRYNPMLMVDPPGNESANQFAPEDGEGMQLVQGRFEFVSTKMRAIDPKEVLTADEVPWLLQASADECFPPVVRIRHMLDVYTGLRHGELNGLQWEFLNLETGVLRVVRSLTELKGAFLLERVKTEAGRRAIELGAKLTRELKLWKLQCPPNEWNLVLPSELGQPARRSTNDSRLKRACKLAGILAKKANAIAKADEFPVLSMNNLRHTYATQSLIAGVDPLELARLMGHQSKHTTESIYARWCEREKSNAAALLEARLNPGR